MVEVTGPALETIEDMNVALKHLGWESADDLHYWAVQNDIERFDQLVQAFATHRTQSTAALAAENERLRGLLTAAAQETVALRVMLGAGCDANNDEHHEIIGTGKDAFCHKCGEMTPRGKSKAWFSEERMERIMNRLAARAALDGK